MNANFREPTLHCDLIIHRRKGGLKNDFQNGPLNDGPTVKGTVVNREEGTRPCDCVKGDEANETWAAKIKRGILKLTTKGPATALVQRGQTSLRHSHRATEMQHRTGFHDTHCTYLNKLIGSSGTL